MNQNQYHRNVKKDYQRKNSPNPFFSHKSSEKGRISPRFWVLGGLLAVIFLIWFFCAAPFWRLQDIKVSGLTRLDPALIRTEVWNQTAQKRWVMFQESNIFLFDETAMKKKIMSDYNLAGVEIKKKWPRTLDILISERPYAFIFQEGSALSYASSDGYVIKEPAVTEDDKKKYFILENKNPGTLVGDKDKISINSDYLNFIFELNGQLVARPGLPIEKFIIDQEFNTIKVKFLSGPLVYFNTKDSAASQVGNLVLVKNDKIKDNFSKTNYIDLRYGEKIYINPEFK